MFLNLECLNGLNCKLFYSYLPLYFRQLFISVLHDVFIDIHHVYVVFPKLMTDNLTILLNANVTSLLDVTPTLYQNKNAMFCARAKYHVE